MFKMLCKWRGEIMTLNSTKYPLARIPLRIIKSSQQLSPFTKRKQRALVSMAMWSPFSVCIKWKWEKVKHRRPDKSIAVWHISAHYVCIAPLNSVIAGQAGADLGINWDEKVGGGWVQMPHDGLRQDISASLNTPKIFSSNIVTRTPFTLSFSISHRQRRLWYELESQQVRALYKLHVTHPPKNI